MEKRLNTFRDKTPSTSFLDEVLKYTYYPYMQIFEHDTLQYVKDLMIIEACKGNKKLFILNLPDSVINFLKKEGFHIEVEDLDCNMLINKKYVVKAYTIYWDMDIKLPVHPPRIKYDAGIFV